MDDAIGRLISKSSAIEEVTKWPYIVLTLWLSILSFGIIPLAVTFLCRRSMLDYYENTTNEILTSPKSNPNPHHVGET
jgi:hypothetical protein